MLDSVFIFLNGFYRTGFFAGNRDVHNGMVGTCIFTNSAINAFAVVDMCLPVFHKCYRIFGTIHGAGATHTAFAQIGNHVIGFHTGSTGFIHYRKYRFAGLCTLNCPVSIIGEGSQFVFLYFYRISQNGQHFVFQNSSFLVDTAPSAGFGIFGFHLHRNPVDVVNKPVFFVQRN